MWAKAVWVEDPSNADETVGTVPLNWIDEAKQILYWPPDEDVTKMYRERHTPAKTWLRFRLVKIRIKSEKKKVCEACKDDTEEEVLTEKRVSKKKERENFVESPFFKIKTFDYVYDHSESPAYLTPIKSQSILLTKLPTPPVKVEIAPEFTSQEEHNLFSSLEQSVDTFTELQLQQFRLEPPQLEPLPQRRRSPMKREADLKRLANEDTSDDETILLTPPSRPKVSRNIVQTVQDILDRDDPIASTSSQNQSGGVYPMSEGKFQRTVMNALIDIRTRLKNLEKMRSEVPGETPVKIAQMKTIDEFHRIETSLVDKRTNEEYVRQLSTMGADNPSKHTNRILERLFTNELMGHFNFAGTNRHGGFRKTALEGTYLYDVVKRAVINAHKDGTEDIVKKATQKCLANAPFRQGGGGKRN